MRCVCVRALLLREKERKVSVANDRRKPKRRTQNNNNKEEDEEGEKKNAENRRNLITRATARAFLYLLCMVALKIREIINSKSQDSDICGI